MSHSGSAGGGGSTSATGVSKRKTKRDTIPILEEQAVVQKEVVTTGRVQIAVHTTLSDEVAALDLEGVEVDVTRVAIGKPITGELPQTRTEGDLTIVPVFEEILVVEKRLMLKEELHIRRRNTVERVEVPVQLRKQQADIQRVDE